jgi:hypothetical protein
VTDERCRGGSVAWLWDKTNSPLVLPDIFSADVQNDTF